VELAGPVAPPAGWGGDQGDVVHDGSRIHLVRSKMIEESARTR